MRTLRRIINLEFLPISVDFGLLILRVWLGLSLLLLHGWTKLSGFRDMSGKFPDPLGIGHEGSLALAAFGEVVGAILLILGFLTRFAATTCVITMGVAFLLVHHLALKGPGNGELAFIYLAGFVTLFIAGPGHFALDGKSGSAAKP